MKIYLSFLGCTPNFISLLSEWILFILMLGSWAVVDLKESSSRFNIPVYDKIISKLGFWSAFRNTKLKKYISLACKVLLLAIWSNSCIVSTTSAESSFWIYVWTLQWQGMYSFQRQPNTRWMSENSCLCRAKSCFLYLLVISLGFTLEMCGTSLICLPRDSLSNIWSQLMNKKL